MSIVDTSPSTPQQQPFLTRVAGYSLVNRAQGLYNFAKQNSPQVIKTGVFDLCENVVLSVAQQPLVVKVLETAQIAERSSLLLDKFDSAVSKVNNLNRQRQEIQSNVTNVVHTVSRAVSHPLDVALEAVDKYMPEEEEEEHSDFVVLSKISAQPQVNETIGDTSTTEETSVAKLSKLTTKLQKVAKTKLNGLKLRSEEQLVSMQFAVNLIEYAKQHSLVDYVITSRMDPKTVAQVTDAVSQAVGVAHHTVIKATEVAQHTLVKAKDAAVQTTEIVHQTMTKVTEIAKEKGVVAKAKLNHYSLLLKESQWKKQFDEIMGPFLASLQTRAQRATVVTVSALAVVVDFTMQQFKLAKEKEFSQVLSNVAKLTKQAVDQTKSITNETVLQLENVLDSVQQILRSLISKSSTLNLSDTIKYILELQTRLTSALSLVSPLALTSPSSTA